MAKGSYWTPEEIDAIWQAALEAAWRRASTEERRVWDNLVAQAETQS